MSFLSPSDSATPAQPAVEGAPPPILGTQGKKPKAANQRTSFLGMDATPGPASGNAGGKTLLGD